MWHAGLPVLTRAWHQHAIQNQQYTALLVLPCAAHVADCELEHQACHGSGVVWSHDKLFSLGQCPTLVLEPRLNFCLNFSENLFMGISAELEQGCFG